MLISNVEGEWGKTKKSLIELKGYAFRKVPIDIGTVFNVLIQVCDVVLLSVKVPLVI